MTSDVMCSSRGVPGVDWALDDPEVGVLFYNTFGQGLFNYISYLLLLFIEHTFYENCK